MTLATEIRSLSSNALNRLRCEIPKSYQEVSTAHPYLPFFHRIEAVLAGLAEFDPEDDDVVLIEADDPSLAKKPPPPPAQSCDTPPSRSAAPYFTDPLDEEDPPASPPTRKNGTASPERHDHHYPHKRKRADCTSQESPDSAMDRYQQHVQQQHVPQYAPQYAENNSDSDSDIICMGTSAPPSAAADTGGASYHDRCTAGTGSSWRCSICVFQNDGGDGVCQECGMPRADGPTDGTRTDDHLLGDLGDLQDIMGSTSHAGSSSPSDASASPRPADHGRAAHAPRPAHRRTDDLAAVVGHLPCNVRGQKGYWDHHWPFLMSLFSSLLMSREAVDLVDPVDEARLILEDLPAYRSVVRNPLCFRTIVDAMGPGAAHQGLLPGIEEKLSVWRGRDLIQAIDLVFLNTLCYNGKAKTQRRYDCLKLRRMFWKELESRVMRDQMKDHLPMKRGETSGYVMWKQR